MHFYFAGCQRILLNLNVYLFGKPLSRFSLIDQIMYLKVDKNNSSCPRCEKRLFQSLLVTKEKQSWYVMLSQHMSSDNLSIFFPLLLLALYCNSFYLPCKKNNKKTKHLLITLKKNLNYQNSDLFFLQSVFKFSIVT